MLIKSKHRIQDSFKWRKTATLGPGHRSIASDGLYEFYLKTK
jgi:hypothetical protein